MAETKKQTFEKGMSPAGVFSYPWLNKPDTKWKKEGEYKVTQTLSEEACAPIREKIDALTDAHYDLVKADLEDKAKNGKDGKAKAAAKEALKKLKKTMPFKESVNDEGDPNGDYEFTFKTKASYIKDKGKPTEEIVTKTVPIFDAKKNKVTAKVFGGTVGKVAFEYFPYHNAATGDCGVSLRLNAVQVIKLVSGSGGGTADSYGFDDEDGDDLSSSEGDEFSSSEGGNAADQGDEF